MPQLLQKLEQGLPTADGMGAVCAGEGGCHPPCLHEVSHDHVGVGFVGVFRKGSCLV
jgi:hypothetical protein